MLSDYVHIGSVISPFGLKGWVKIRLFLQNINDIKRYLSLKKEKGESIDIQEFKIKSPDVILAKIKGIDNRSQAETLKRQKLFIPKEQLPSLELEEYYVHDLINMTVIDEKGQEIGNVCDVHNFGSTDIIEIKTKGVSYMIPFTKEAVVDLKNNQLYICSSYLISND
ncbi:MAG: 16S rRNA processing protein RimM [Proteobacteria bacterium]|nr:16S rRNA processing protein RimM [Pseudomonadota bacterium]